MVAPPSPELGINVVGGSKFDAEGLTPFVEVRIELEGYEQIVVTGGVVVPQARELTPGRPGTPGEGRVASAPWDLRPAGLTYVPGGSRPGFRRSHGTQRWTMFGRRVYEGDAPPSRSPQTRGPS